MPSGVLSILASARSQFLTLCCCRRGGEQWLAVNHNGFIIKVKGPTVMYTLPIDHKVKMKVSYVDAAGNPAAVDGPVVWTSSDASLASVTAEAGDSTICEVVPVGPLGQVQVIAHADADIGSGVTELLTTCDISLVAGEAVSGSIQPVGDPTPIS